MNVPLLDLKSEYRLLKKDLDKQWRDCCSAQGWILGEKVEHFEAAAARYLGVKYAVGVASGTDALLLPLRALAIKTKKREFFRPQEEIITTPFTFIATAEAIVRSGARPVFVDIDPDTYTIDPAAVERAVSKRTVGIIPVHLFGLGADMRPLRTAAGKHNLFIVEDVAQAFGARCAGKRLGALSQAGAFSFFPSKNLGSYGDGGLVSTDDAGLAELIMFLRNHGESKRYNAGHIGYTSRLDALQAAILSVKLKHCDRLNRARGAVAHRYNQALKSIPGLSLPVIPKGRTHVFNLYTVSVPAARRDALVGYLHERGVQARIYYPVPLHRMKAYAPAKRGGVLTCCEAAAKQVLSLPAHPFLRPQQVTYVAKVIKSFFIRKGEVRTTPDQRRPA